MMKCSVVSSLADPQWKPKHVINSLGHARIKRGVEGSGPPYPWTIQIS